MSILQEKTRNYEMTDANRRRVRNRAYFIEIRIDGVPYMYERNGRIPLVLFEYLDFHRTAVCQVINRFSLSFYIVSFANENAAILKHLHIV